MTSLPIRAQQIGRAGSRLKTAVRDLLLAPDNRVGVGPGRPAGRLRVRGPVSLDASEEQSPTYSRNSSNPCTHSLKLLESQRRSYFVALRRRLYQLVAAERYAHASLPLPARARGERVWAGWGASSRPLGGPLVAHWRPQAAPGDAPPSCSVGSAGQNLDKQDRHYQLAAHARAEQPQQQ